LEGTNEFIDSRTLTTLLNAKVIFNPWKTNSNSNLIDLESYKMLKDLFTNCLQQSDDDIISSENHIEVLTAFYKVVSQDNHFTKYKINDLISVAKIDKPGKPEYSFIEPRLEDYWRRDKLL
jgi:hypothetical protein